MAASDIFQGGQTAIDCQLCEETHEIKWKCMTCEFFICTRCCKIHKKVKSTGNHDIVNIKDITSLPNDFSKIKCGNHDGQKDITVPKDFSKIKCRYHDHQMCCLFCQDCIEVVCPLCIASAHNKHNMEEIGEEYKFSVKRLKEMSSKLDKECKDLKQDASTLKSARSAEKNKYETEKQNILHQDKAVKDAVDQHNRKLLSDLDEKWNIVVKSITSEETKISQQTKDVEEKKSSVNQALLSEKVDVVLNLVKKETVVEMRDQRYVHSKYEKLPNFVPGEITQAKIESLNGYFQDEIELSVEDVSSINYPCIQNLLSCADGSVWISNHDSKILQNINFQSGNIHVNKTYIIKVLYMACTPNGDLLLSTGTSELLIIPKTTGQIKVPNIRIRAGPDLVTYGVHVTRDNKILLAANAVAPKFHVKGQVIKMNMDGIKERVYSVDNYNEPLFCFPHRITTDSKHNIYVIDMISNYDNGQIVMLDKWGIVKAIYAGHPLKNRHKTFSPVDFVVTESDNLIVTESTCHGLHILNNEGQCIAYKDISQIGIQYPHSLDIANKASLLVGTLDESHFAKIYTVHFSGF